MNFKTGWISKLVREAYAVRRPCSDFMDMLRRLISCRIIIIIIIIIILFFLTLGRYIPEGFKKLKR